MADEYEYPPNITPNASITSELFLQWRSPRYGQTNPELMNNPVWEWLINNKITAYTINKHFDGPSAFDSGPCWCFSRFGQSSTELDDGRVVLIAGEHEDYYDPDFYIYNDVVVKKPDGTLDIYGYPKEVFTPTDFHSATLAGKSIIVIGSLGYPNDRKLGSTQVYVLDLSNFSIATVQCNGNSPGWLHRHNAVYSSEDNAILITGGLIETGDKNKQLPENIDDWKLHLTDWRWERLTERKWQRWDLYRKDRKRNALWDIRELEFYKTISARGDKWGKEQAVEALSKVRKELGFEPDLSLLTELYNPPIPHETLPKNEDEYNVYRIKIDGVTVRYIEDGWFIRITVEGDLPAATGEALASDILNKVSALEKQPYELVRL